MLRIYKHRWIFIAVSIAVILAGFVGYFVRGGFNIDIDFAGGTSIKFDTNTASSTKEEITTLLEETLPKHKFVVQSSLDKPTEFTCKTTTLSTSEINSATNALTAKYKMDEKAFEVQSFEAAYGKQLAQEAGLALFVAIALMLIYITFRFEFLQGVSAIIALCHDTLIMLSIYAIFGVSVNSSFIAVILTILGYSINNTIVVFDRVRENRKYARKETTEEIVDKSITGTVGRSINTTLTTLIMVVCLYILGGESIKEFAFPLIIGLLGGAYSSVFLVSPIWAMMKGSNKKNTKKA